MTNNRIWMAGAGILAAAIVALSWLLGIGPRLSEAAAFNEQRVAAESVNAVHSTEIAALKVDFAEIDAVRSELEQYRAYLPPQEDMDSFIRDLSAAVDGSGVVFDSYTIAEPQNFLPTTPVAAEAAAEEPVVPQGEVVGAPEAAPVSPDSLSTIAVTLNVSGDYAKSLQFTNLLQEGDRIFLVTAIRMAGSADEGQEGMFKTTVEGLVYVLSDPTLATSGSAESTAGGSAAEEPAE